jgi:hypothetical protein
LEYLNLAHAEFQEEYIDLIPPTVNRLLLDGTKLTRTGVAKLAALTTVTPVPMFQLSITDSGVDDDAVQPLKDSNITELHIDATRLTTAACDALAHIDQVELVYEASAMSLDEITMHYGEMRQTLLAAKKARGIPLSSDIRRKPTLLGIRNLKVEASLLPSVKSLRDCTLYDVQIVGRPGIELTLEPTDLDRFFTPQR